MKSVVAIVASTFAFGALFVVGAPEASAAPAFQVPFPCDQSWEGQTRADHSPANAVDFSRASADGDPVAASASGTVSRVENEGSESYGRWIEINHGGGWTTRYAHLSRQLVSEGEKVSPGQLIGNVGNTGGSTGPHLHFEELLDGTAVEIEFDGRQIEYWGTDTYTSNNTCTARNEYTPQEVCGSGYKVIDWRQLGRNGTVYLLFNDDRNCVATIKATRLGTASPAEAFIEVEGGSRATDNGNFSYFAGPVTKAAAGKCVKWGGAVGDNDYTSPFEHCG